MAGCAFHLGVVMLSMAEKDEIGQSVNSFFRWCRGAVLVAGKAAGRSGETGLLRRARTGVAANTLQI
jgi:hypothetical protein